MASSPPDSHPDSPPSGPSEDIEQVSPGGDPGRESVEDVPEEESAAIARRTDKPHHRSPLDGAGIEDGVAGTGGVNEAQDDLAR